jgi:hypothetical protein
LLPGTHFLDEAERAGADHFGDLLVGVGRGLLLAHHVADGGAGLGQHIDHQAVGLVQAELEAVLAGRHDLLHAPHHVLAAAVARRPAIERGDAVLGGDRRAVVPLEAVAQHELVDQLVVADLPGIDHLRLGLQIRVDPEQRVEDYLARRNGAWWAF